VSALKLQTEHWILVGTLLVLAAAAVYQGLTLEPVVAKTAVKSGKGVVAVDPAVLAVKPDSQRQEAIWKEAGHQLFIPRLIVFFPTTKEFTPLDLDNEGPDKIKFRWKLDNGFPLDDPTTKDQDPDADGFNNYEEYVAQTEPKNKDSAPPVIQKLRLEKYTQVLLDIDFKGYNPDPESTTGGMIFQINLPNAPKNKSRQLRLGDEVEGYILKDFKKITGMRMNPKTGIEEPFDDSELSVYDPLLDKTLVLVFNKKAKSDKSNVSFKLLVPKEAPTPANVQIGNKFKIRETEYQLRSAEKGQAVIRDLKAGKEYQIHRDQPPSEAPPEA
jgi:hypothetical protein